MKIQELLIDRGLALNELHKIFAEFDTSGDMQLDCVSARIPRARDPASPLASPRQT